MTEYLWVGTDDYFSMDPDAERDTTEGIYNATWTIPKSQYEKLSKADQKKFLPLPFFFQEGAKDSTGREVYLIDQDGDDVDIYAYKGYDDLFYSFSIGPDNQFLNYYAVEPTYTTWTEMRDEVKSKREAGKDPDGTFTITKFITDPDKIKKEWKDSKRKNMREPKAAETDFSAENVEYKFALIGKYPDSDVSEATWEQLPEGMEAIGKTHVTLVSGQSLKEYKKDLKAGAKAAIKEMREPPLPELGQTGVAHRDMADGEVRETYFMEIDNQEDFQDYADELCENLGIANPEPHRYFHISVANNHGGNPFKSVGDITAADLHGFSAENIPLGYVATLAADGETITVGPDKWLADTYGLQTFAVSDDAYTLAYNEGHQDARHKRGYHPRVAKGDERDFFRNTYTAKRQGYKAETFEAGGWETIPDVTPHLCVTCDEDMSDELLWGCQCCGMLVGTRGDHEGCGEVVLPSVVVCKMCIEEGHEYPNPYEGPFTPLYLLNPSERQAKKAKSLHSTCKDLRKTGTIKMRREPLIGGWSIKKTFEAKGNRPRDTKGRMVPKQGVTKWGNNYWDYGVTYQEWKYRHPASVRVFAEGWGVDLKSLTPEQKDWLKWRYMEDVDSQTSLAALVDEFKLSAPKRP